MKNSFKSIKKKTSIFRMHKEGLLLFIICVGLLCVVTDMVTNPAHETFYKNIIYGFSYIVFGIIVIAFIVSLIYVLFKFLLNLYNQTKLPLKKEEMEKLNITSPDEYLKFVNNYMPNIVPSKNIQNRIIFTSYLYLYDGDTDEEKEKNLHNAFKFSKVPVCVDNYEYIYDFSNKVTVCHDKDFNKLVKKLFSNKAYSETFGEKEYY